MIALTVRQPFASRITDGVKRVENRSRPTSLRGQFLVHAGARIHALYPDATLRELGVYDHVKGLPRSAVIGAVQVVDSHNAEACPDWRWCADAGGHMPTLDEPVVHHWVLADPVEFVTPIPRVLGALGFWRPDDRVQHLAGMELEAAAARA